MKRLLSIELQKLWLNKACRVLIISYFVILSFIALIASLKINLLGVEINIAEQGIFNFPYIWHFNTFLAAGFKMFLAVVIVSMVSNEYTYGTLKQNLIDGMSKSEFIKSKYLTVGLFAVASTVFLYVMTLILGYSFSAFDEASIVFSSQSFVLAYFLKLLCYFSFCLFVGILIKRSAFAIGFVFVWFVVEKIIQIVNGAITGKFDSTDTFVQFLPLQSMFNLIQQPFDRLATIRSIQQQLEEGSATEVVNYYPQTYQFVVVILWTAFFLIMSYRILKKRDL